MKLILDEMWPRSIAVELRARGHDVDLLADRGDLRSRPDWFVFAAAQTEGRVIVTEDAKDYRRLASDRLLSGGSHVGLVLTTNRAFPRGNPATPGRVIASLHELLISGAELTNLEHWLRPPDP